MLVSCNDLYCFNQKGKVFQPFICDIMWKVGFVVIFNFIKVIISCHWW